MELLTQLLGHLQDPERRKHEQWPEIPPVRRKRDSVLQRSGRTHRKQEIHELSNAAVSREHLPAEGGVLRPSFSIESGVTHENPQSFWVPSDTHVLFYSFSSFSLYTRLRQIRMSRAWCTAASILVTSSCRSHVSLVKIPTLRDASHQV